MSSSVRHVSSTPVNPFMANSVTAQYAASVAAGRVGSDDAQLAVIARLSRLEARIVEHRLARKSSSLGWLFGNRKEREEPL